MLNFSRVHGIQIGSSAQQSFLTPSTAHSSQGSPCPPRPHPTPATTHFSRDNWKYTARTRNEGKVKELTLGCQQNRSANYTIRSLSVWGHSEDSTKAQPQAAAIGYSTTKRQITDSTTATRQLSSLKPNDESRRKGNKERRK